MIKRQQIVNMMLLLSLPIILLSAFAKRNELDIENPFIDSVIAITLLELSWILWKLRQMKLHGFDLDGWLKSPSRRTAQRMNAFDGWIHLHYSTLQRVFVGIFGVMALVSILAIIFILFSA